MLEVCHEYVFAASAWEVYEFIVGPKSEWPRTWEAGHLAYAFRFTSTCSPMLDAPRGELYSLALRVRAGWWGKRIERPSPTLPELGVEKPDETTKWILTSPAGFCGLYLLQSKPRECTGQFVLETNPGTWRLIAPEELQESVALAILIEAARHAAVQVWRGVVQDWEEAHGEPKQRTPPSWGALDAPEMEASRGGAPKLRREEVVYRIAAAIKAEEVYSAARGQKTWRVVAREIRWRHGFALSGVKLLEDARKRLQGLRAADPEGILLEAKALASEI